MLHTTRVRVASLLRRLDRWRRATPRQWMRRVVVTAALTSALGLLTIAGGEIWVRAAAHGHVHPESSVPAAPVALVLGAEVYADGNPSPFLAARLDIAQRLLQAGTVKAILLSGDHGHWTYDEPTAMRDYLVAHGVARDRLVLDYAGFDTYDSCARARRIFGVQRAIVVTQRYHVDRAVALCRALGVDAYGVGDSSVKIYTGPWRRCVIRERGAIAKAVYDVLSGRDPALLGPHEPGVDNALRTAG